jgi:hypothetical protein
MLGLGADLAEEVLLLRWEVDEWLLDTMVVVEHIVKVRRGDRAHNFRVLF